LRAHVHDAFGDSGGVDYRRRRENEGLVGVLEASLGRCAERLMQDAPLLDDDDNDDDNRKDDSIDVHNDIDNQAISNMPVVVAAGMAAVVENDRGGTHVHNKCSTIEEILSQQQWGHITADVFPLDPRFRK
jgi:hypothetical protein